MKITPERDGCRTMDQSRYPPSLDYIDIDTASCSEVIIEAVV